MFVVVLNVQCCVLLVLNDIIFEMGEKLKEVRVTTDYSHVGLPTQVTLVSRLRLSLHLAVDHMLSGFADLNRTDFNRLQCFDAVGWAAGRASGL